MPEILRKSSKDTNAKKIPFRASRKDLSEGTQMRLFSLLSWLPLVSAIHFYANPGETRCFYEEVTKNTVVVTHFDALVQTTREYESVPNLKLLITVDETFDNDHRTVSQKSPAQGEFTFSAIESGEHRLCITPQYADKKAHIRVFFDLVQLGSEVLDSQKKDTVTLLTNKVKEVNNKLQEIKREQELIRERESSFRDRSESTNGKVVLWSLIQLTVLGATCFWQLRHLKTFFVKQKVL